MCNNFDYINFRGIEMVRTLRLQTIRERRYYSLCILMFKCTHGLAPHYLCNDVTMYVDINGYDTRSAEKWIYIYHVAQGKFIKGVFSTKAVPFGISYRHV